MYRRLGFGEVDVCVEQHGDVLVSCFQSDGQGIALILNGRRQDGDQSVIRTVYWSIYTRIKQ